MRGAITARQVAVEQPLRSCLLRIEVACTIDCCGIEALRPTPVLVGLWADSVGPEKAADALSQVRSIIAICSESPEPIACDFLGYRERNPSDRERFRHFFERVASALDAPQFG